jgi:hypothetical protein
MAKVLDSFPDAAKHSRENYPWDEWLDGKIRELRAGEDFWIKRQSFRARAMQKAYDRGGTVRMANMDDGKTIVLQFVKHHDSGNGSQPDQG